MNNKELHQSLTITEILDNLLMEEQRKMDKEFYDWKKLKALANATIIVPSETAKTLHALMYLEDMAHGRKMPYRPSTLRKIIEKSVLAFELIRQCFKLNGFDELIPNEKWRDNESLQDFVKEMLK